MPRIVLALSGRHGEGEHGSEPAATGCAAEETAEDGCDAAGSSAGAEEQQLPGAAGWAAGGDIGSEADATNDQQEAQQQQRQQQQQQQQQQNDASPADREWTSTAARSRSGAKENQQPAAKQAGAQAAARALVAVVTQRSGNVRQRRANSQLSGYLVDLE